MPITAIDIQQQQFKSRPFGYEKGGVDRFLEQVADEVERLSGQNQELKETLALTRASLEEMRARELTLQETLLTTQRVTDELKSNARKEAELVIAEAHLRAERIVRDAEERRLQLIGEIQEVKRQKVAFETGLRHLVESQLRLLDMDVVSVTGGSVDRLLDPPLPFDRHAAGDKEPGSEG